MRGLLQRLWDRMFRSEPTDPGESPAGRVRGSVDHVILLDGTMGALKPELLTSIGLIYRLLRRAGPRVSVHYNKGLQWHSWRDLHDLWFGWGVNHQILRAYGWLSMRYRPGDRIFLIGYSRGGFAARSLAGMIDRAGLLRPEHATERNVRLAWRYYEAQKLSPVAGIFRKRFCHETSPIEMVGVFDSVRALGIQLPLLWALSEPRWRFHDDRLGPSVNHGYQALAYHETRRILTPLIWDSTNTGANRIEQVWFRGVHGDIGGQLGAFEAARPLANIPLVWMLERAEALGLALPPGWRAEFPTDPDAPSVGSWRFWGRFFLMRGARVVGRDLSERLHETVSVPRRRFALPWRAGSAGLAHDEAGRRAGGVKFAIRRAPDLASGDPG